MAYSEQIRTMKTWLLNFSLSGKSHSAFLYVATTQSLICASVSKNIVLSAGGTNWICRVSPHKFSFVQKGFVLLRQSSFFPGSCIMCTARKAITKVDDV